MPTEVTARTLVKLLEDRYDKDHYTTSEIKAVTTGERLDFVAIRASWSDQTIHGFECKVARGDFLNDNKWPAYLPACHQFWFVTKAGIVKRDEIPEQAGWLEASVNGCKLFMRKKAPRREIEWVNQAKLFRQIIHRLHFHPYEDPETSRAEQYAKFIEAKALERDFGTRIGNAVRESVRAWKVKVEETEKTIAGYAGIAAFLESRGVKPEQIKYCAQNSRWGRGTEGARYLIEKHAPELIQEIPPELMNLERAARILEEAAKETAQRIRLAHQNVCALTKAEAGKKPL